MNESKAEHSSDNCANDEQIIGIIIVIIRPALRLMHYITAAVAIHAVHFIDCSATLVLAAVTCSRIIGAICCRLFPLYGTALQETQLSQTDRASAAHTVRRGHLYSIVTP